MSAKGTTLGNLVEVWLDNELEYHVDTLAAAVQSMNEALGRRYTLSCINGWSHGHRLPDRPAHHFMRTPALPHALAQSGFDVQFDADDYIALLTQALTLPACASAVGE